MELKTQSHKAAFGSGHQLQLVPKGCPLLQINAITFHCHFLEFGYLLENPWKQLALIHSLLKDITKDADNLLKRNIVVECEVFWKELRVHMPSLACS